MSSQQPPTPGTKKRPDEAMYPALLVIVVLLILPHFGAVAMMIGSAVGLAGYVFLMPDHFRTRSGSLALAIVLVAALILVMVFALAISLLSATTGLRSLSLPARSGGLPTSATG